MFDIGAAELLVIVIVAILVIGPKDMPVAMRTAGRWIGKVRRVSTHFRTGLDAMVREAELEEMEKKWKAQNEEIMARTSKGETGGEIEGDGTEMTGPPVSADGDPYATSTAIDATSGDPPADKSAAAEAKSEAATPSSKSDQKDAG